MGVPLQQHLIGPGVIYIHHPHHRNGNANKSQWTILEVEERASFQGAQDRHWMCGNKGWGLHIVGGIVDYLGVAQDHVERLIVAKFVNTNAQNHWHGYPIDHRDATDAPDPDVIKDWIENEVLPPAKISKIHGGKRCKL